MLCPTDGTTLVMSERKGVEIDYCPTCRGVWLDRGELDKIIDRSVEAEIAAEAGTRPAGGSRPGAGPADPPDYRAVPSGGYEQPRYDQPQYGGERYGQRYDEHGYGDRDGYRRKKKRESWLEDLFDF